MIEKADKRRLYDALWHELYNGTYHTCDRASHFVKAQWAVTGGRAVVPPMCPRCRWESMARLALGENEGFNRRHPPEATP